MQTQESRITKAMLRRSHKAQFYGKDYQAIAWEIGQELKFEPTQDELCELESSPNPGCECGFCNCTRQGRKVPLKTTTSLQRLEKNLSDMKALYWVVTLRSWLKS